MARKKTIKELVLDSREKHGCDTYNYELFTEYVNNKTPVTLICNKHNKPFNVSINDHLGKKLCGCPICGLENRRNRESTTTYEEFVTKLKELHGDKYEAVDNLKTYGVKEYATLICPIHGEFKKQIQELYKVRNGKVRGCQKCSHEERYPHKANT